MPLGKQVEASTFCHSDAMFTCAVTLFMNFEVSAIPFKLMEHAAEQVQDWRCLGMQVGIGIVRNNTVENKIN